MKRNKLLLLISSLGVLVLLGVAMVEENVRRDWRRLQRSASAAAPDLEVRLRQVVAPGVGASDRCTTCHLGMAPGEPAAPGVAALAPHPPIAHDPAELGCTVCHAGQGRATDREDAHGTVPHWPEPMVPTAFAEAGCGTCHVPLGVPEAETLAQARAVFERADCLACHRLDGRGGTLRPGAEQAPTAPDLSRAGVAGHRADWYEHHLARAASGEAAGGIAWATSFGPLSGGERRAIETLLAVSVGAPLLVESKAEFLRQGCLGCHKVAGVGGDEALDLTAAGRRDPGQLDFTGVGVARDAPGSLAAWQAAHLRAPAAVVAGSLMPALGLGDAEIERLTLFLLSLRRGPLPAALWPTDRLRAERFGAREFAGDGATLYAAFCSACHGQEGEGMRFAGQPPFPAIANPDLLALADDAFLAETVRRGRPGRRMAAWGEKEGGLRPDEVAAVVLHLRKLGGVNPEPDPRPARWVAGDPGAGGRIYSAACSGCHGAKGEGGEGPALANPVLLSTAGDTFLVETIRRGRRGTSMEGFARPSPIRPALADAEIEAVVAYVRGWERGG